MRLLGALIYTISITFQYQENYDIQQLFGPIGDKCYNFYGIQLLLVLYHTLLLALASIFSSLHYIN
jgi:hypothetical protein